ncbi:MULTISPECIES: hypothetical protein [unclassified Mesorhizobium]|uniref:hypothetical protein n=1 Tax=unclassified Mesorhizobium TaxID=325217 RepID=UPI00333E1346
MGERSVFLPYRACEVGQLLVVIDICLRHGEHETIDIGHQVLLGVSHKAPYRRQPVRSFVSSGQSFFAGAFIAHSTPKGSRMLPHWSPQNISCSGTATSQPASTARFHQSSISSAPRWSCMV